MKKDKIYISGIPALIWGEKSDKVYIHVHGKCSKKEYAAQFAKIADGKGIQTLSFDLPEHGERSENHEYRCNIQNGMHDLSAVADYVFSRWKHVSLFACSIGAYFSLNAYKSLPFEKCLFQSPMIDMEYMIRSMLSTFGVTEERLQNEGEIDTPFELLSWDYFQYVLAHPIKKWDIPTAILYAAKDNLQPYGIIKAFTDAHDCALTVSENSEHPFMDAGDIDIVGRWLTDNM